MMGHYRLSIVFFVLSALLAATLPMTGCVGRPSAITHLHCELRTDAGGVRTYWVTENGDLDLTLSASLRGAGPTEVLFGLFVDGRQWPAVWDGQQAMLKPVTLGPDSSQEVEFGIRGLPQGVHALYLLCVVLPTCGRNLTESHIMHTQIAMYPFTVESRSPIGPLPDKVVSATPGPDTAVLQAIGLRGVLCVSANDLAIDLSFDIRDRQTLYYAWRNDSDGPVQVRFVLLVDWLQTPWPTQDAEALEFRAEPSQAVLEEIDLSALPIDDMSYLVVVAFLRPLLPMWLLDDSGQVYLDPEGGDAFSSNCVVVLGP
ncbi:MAG: hypothetical protein K6U08_03380 [Firmicutes bacterium]|nr:hypothetical protein [Bacillota bacterium]